MAKCDIFMCRLTTYSITVTKFSKRERRQNTRRRLHFRALVLLAYFIPSGLMYLMMQSITRHSQLWQCARNHCCKYEDSANTN